MTGATESELGTSCLFSKGNAGSFYHLGISVLVFALKIETDEVER